MDATESPLFSISYVVETYLVYKARTACCQRIQVSKRKNAFSVNPKFIFTKESIERNDTEFDASEEPDQGYVKQGRYYKTRQSRIEGQDQNN